MSSLPEPISALISALNGLPGVGPRSAERIALHLAQAEPELVRQLAQAILTARERIQTCQTCGALTDVQPCAICSHPRRDGSLICLVEQPVDIISIEKSGTYDGKYHVLAGKISPLNGVGPEDLRIAELETRHQFLSGQAIRRKGSEAHPHRSRPARRKRTGICRRIDAEPSVGGASSNELRSAVTNPSKNRVATRPDA